MHFIWHTCYSSIPSGGETLGKEDWQGEEGGGRGGGEGGKGAALMKSSNPHLAGGELLHTYKMYAQHTKVYICVCVYIDTCTYIYIYMYI